MPLMTFRNVTLSFGADANVLEGASFSIEAKERIALIGRNGTGKSSLLKLIHQEIPYDLGEIERAPNLKVAKLQQEIPLDLQGTLFDLVAGGLVDLPEWEITHRVEAILSKMKLSPELEVSSLSGGYIRRALIARAVVSEPDILLLDEPTNHLDIESIDWLEQFLANYQKTVLFVTHDRRLLQAVATRILELDRGKILSWKGTYENFLVHKEAELAAESTRNALFDKKLAEEERWIRQGVKARRVRDQGRVARLQKMRAERQARVLQPGQVNFRTQSSELSGKLVFELAQISHTYEDKPVISDFSATVMRGDKIGIIGANGCGKSTLLRILLKQLEPLQGTVRHGTQLNISYFDQRREQLDESKPVIDNICDGGDFVTIDGKSIHVMSYLSDFLFSPQRARSPVKVLSGGERHRLLLARLFTRPSNVLILDEPTNDLDFETLALLEEHLLAYTGTLLVVSHDRTFLDNLVTSTWVFEGNAHISEYVGGYEDAMRQSTPKLSLESKEKISIASPTRSPQLTRSLPLNSKEKRELESLPDKIEQLESDIAIQQNQMAASDFYKQDKADILSAQKKLESLEHLLAQTYQRWEALLARSSPH